MLIVVNSAMTHGVSTNENGKLMKLFPYQVEGAEFLASRKRALLADSMGLGKTAQAISACVEMFLPSVLVICPASLKSNWRAEIAKWDVGNHCDFTIVSYNYCQKEENIKALLLGEWHALICDEAHALKSWSSKQTKNILLKLAPNCDRVWLLTGTPATRSAADYHPILSVLEPGVHGKYKDFCNRYCLSKPGYGYAGAVQYYGFRNTEELQQKVAKVSLRRLKRDVMKQLPNKIHTVLDVEIDPEVFREAESAMGGDFPAIEAVVKAMEGGVVGENLSEIVHAVGMEKVPHAIDFINNCGVPLVVFAWHRDVISAIVEGCNGDVGAIHGGVSAEQKAKLVKMFQDGELDVLVVNIAAGGVGITLTRASHVLFVESCWSPALMLQAEDRVHRIGQDAECVNIYKMVAWGTLDETVYDVLCRKEQGIREVLEQE